MPKMAGSFTSAIAAENQVASAAVRTAANEV